MSRFLLLVVCLQALLLAVECCGDKKASAQPKNDSYIEVCKQEPLELSIVLDASSSIRLTDFEIAKSFLEDYISHFDVGPGREGVRISVIPYGNGTYPEAGFDLTTYNTKEEVLEAICNIKHSLGSYTHTDLGIDYMRNTLMASDVVRPWAKKLSVVLTDGDSTYRDRTKAAAEAARKDGILMFAVGVGSVRRSELLNIAGDASRVITVASYDQLDSIKKDLTRKTCIRTIKPTTQPPKIEKCGEVRPADVNFVFSPADLGADSTAKATSFISKVIADKGLEVGFQFGVVSGSCPLDEGFSLGAYKTVKQYQTRLEQYDLNSLTRLTERLLGDAYSVENGAREGASRVAVIWTSGQETDELAVKVQQLKERGVQVYIVDASGAGGTVGGATILPGGSSTLQAETFINYLCPGTLRNVSTN